MIEAPGLARLWDILPQARIVGGAVRDHLAGRPIADVDLASPLPPDEVMSRLQRAGIRVIPTGISHGTVTALAEGGHFEITTLRRDEQTDGRHAVVAFTDDWREDAARRDFTINAMSMDQAGVLHDYFGGCADLVAGKVRFVGDAVRRITEDHLRILRFFRFYARYAQGLPDEAAVSAITMHRASLRALSAERVWSELKKILQAPDPRGALALMKQTRVLEILLPEFDGFARLNFLITHHAPADPLLRLAALRRAGPSDLATRLKLSSVEAEELADLRRGPALAAHASDEELRRALADAPADILIGRAWLGGIDAQGLGTRLTAMLKPVFPLQGRDVLALGVAPGPAVGEALSLVRQWWLDGGCVADDAACKAELRALFKNESGTGP